MHRHVIEYVKSGVMGLCAVLCAVASVGAPAGPSRQTVALSGVFLVLTAYFAWKAEVFNRERKP